MNINEIARLAGVSRATVSRYLNNGYVSSEKKEVIRRVIQETGYQPSSQAQTLRTKKTSLIGVILPKINSDTISREVTGISDILTRRGYQLILANTNNDLEEELKYLSLFKERQVDGVVFIATMFTRKHKQMLKAVWGNEYDTDTHYIRIYMRQLRRKIEPDPAQPKYLITEAGIGYRLLGGE